MDRDALKQELLEMIQEPSQGNEMMTDDALENKLREIVLKARQNKEAMTSQERQTFMEVVSKGAQLYGNDFLTFDDLMDKEKSVNDQLIALVDQGRSFLDMNDHARYLDQLKALLDAGAIIKVRVV